MSKQTDFDAVITHNVVPMRAEPSGRSEQVSQAIWGEKAVRLAQESEYVRIRTADAYEGWVWERHIRSCDPAFVLEAQTKTQECCVVADFAELKDNPGQDASQVSKLVFGMWMQAFLGDTTPTSEWVQVQLPYGSLAAGTERLWSGFVRKETIRSRADWPYPRTWNKEVACEIACRFMGTPYLWGGTTPFGFDCSGFVQRVYSTLGVILPRDAYMQAESSLGERLAPDAPTQAGDLVFFGGRSDPRKRGITHVGMALGPNAFIHAVGKEGVVITPFDDPYYAAQYAYMGAWRYP